MGPDTTPNVILVAEQRQAGPAGPQIMEGLLRDTHDLCCCPTPRGFFSGPTTLACRRQWVPRRHHKTFGSLSSVRQGAVGPETTTQVLQFTEQGPEENHRSYGSLNSGRQWEVGPNTIPWSYSSLQAGGSES